MPLPTIVTETRRVWAAKRRAWPVPALLLTPPTPLVAASSPDATASEPMPLAAAWGLGLLLFFGGVLLAYVAVLLFGGRIDRNRAVGIRIPSTLASDEAWLRGHRAAAPWLGVAALAAAVPGAIVMLRPSNETGQLVILVGVGLLVAMVAVATFMANIAASSPDGSSEAGPARSGLRKPQDPEG